jgi:hypothetical protein
MSFQKAYNISLSGNVPYPYEQYQAIVNPDYFSIGGNRDFLINNFIRYQRRPCNEILNFLNPKILDPKSNNAILTYDLATSNSYLSANSSFSSTSNIIYDENIETIQVNNSTNIFFNVSSLRTQYKTPQEFQLFYIQNDPNINDCYGYLLYPNRLFLNPVKLDGNLTLGWSLSTKTNIIAWSAVYIGSNTFEDEAHDVHKLYVSRVPSLCSLYDLASPSSYTLNYSVCALRSKMARAILPSNFSSSYQPSIITTSFESDTIKIQPDSTFITFDSTFTNPINERIRLAQTYPYSYVTENAFNFRTTYIIKYDPTVSSVQTFQLIQNSAATVLPLGLESNTILKCTVDLSNSAIVYTSTQASTTGATGTNINLDYIADALNIDGAPAIGTFSSIALDDGTSISLNSAINVPYIYDQNLIWKSSYPPHYYSYKTKLQDSGGNYLDSFGLNFYVKTSALNSQAVDGQSFTTSLQLSTVIASDYNALVYSLYNNIKSNEKIKYTITSASIDLTTARNQLSAQYGPSGITYPLASSPWINADSGSYLKISYPPEFGEIRFAVRASLQGDYGIMDAFEETAVVLSRAFSVTSNGTSISLNVLNEESNAITVDSSYNVSEISWPSRDLRNSKITWSVSPYDSFITLYSVNKNTNSFIRFIDSGEILDFDDTTQTIRVSGYGPELTTITLSSQKYNEQASVRTNPTLFDYFGEGVFSVTPKTPLNNLDRVRTIDLKIQVPFQGRLYDIPQFLNTPIYWTWTFNDAIDPLLQPISAYKPLINDAPYSYGTSANYSLVSAIKIAVLPPTDVKPTIYSITVQANSDIKYPPISGAFTFNVDAFPDKSIFNSDFKTYYKNYSSIEIADTYNELDVITRSADSDLSFALVNNVALLNNTPYQRKTWLLDNTTVLLSSIFQMPSSDFIFVDSNILGLSSYKITLKLDSAIAQGWTSAHNVSANQYFYAIDPIEFYKPLEFILYPEYAWVGNSSTLTILTSSNYTISYRPSAYGNKKNNSQMFWLSANKNIYDFYIYTNTVNFYTSTLKSALSYMDIIYDPEDISIFIGIPISLQCYDTIKYPQRMGTEYYAPTGGSLQLLKFSNYALTKEYNDTSLSGFDLSPTIEPYNDLHLNYTIDTKVINLDVSRNVTITQTISTMPPNTPALIVGGTVTYYLSSQFWTVSSTIPAVDGTFNIFQLNYGDPAIPLYSGQEGIDRYYLYAETRVLQQIPPTTFPSGTKDYSGNTDLWRQIVL